MDWDLAIKKLEALHELMVEYDPIAHSSGERKEELHEKIVQLYGEVADVVEQFEGRAEIKVLLGGGAQGVFPNFIEAGYLSGRSMHSHAGHTQLLKVIGKAKAHAQRQIPPRDEVSLGQLLRILRRFRECSQYLRTPPEDERAVQDVVWIMIRSHFERVDRENTLPQFGLKAYKPDFGIPELRTLIEVKYVGEKTDPRRIQDEILSDVPAYLSSQVDYDGLIAFVYDAAQKLRDPAPFVEDLRSVDTILDVVVVPGIG